MCPNLFSSVKVTELQPFRERAANSACQLYFLLFAIFPFDVWDKLWILILSVSEVSLLIQFIYNADRFQLKNTVPSCTCYNKGHVGQLPVQKVGK